MNPAEVATFAVRPISLEMGADGHPTQKTTARGDHVSVEQAFSVARSLAELERGRRERSASMAGVVRAIELADTAWGYDLRLDGLGATRFWRHDRAAASRVGGEKRRRPQGGGAGRPTGGDDRRGKSVGLISAPRRCGRGR